MVTDFTNRMSDYELAHLGEGALAYLRQIDSDDLMSRFPGVVELASGLKLWALFAADGRPILVADENMLRQVWHNLMGNAVKYSARSEPARIEVEHRRNADGDHHFTVRDNGAGFDMQYAGKLFGVFQRLHAASEFSGTGIGLASVKRVVTRHNGSVWAEAAPGEGATFHFTLPANLDLKPASAP